jgi:anaerobic nitric oxide reductase transcription regulator
VAGALNNALLIARLEAQNVLPPQAVNYPQPERQEIIGLSAPMLQLKKEIDIVAASDLNVLISGETGTGKELVAKAVHQGSPRAANPLVYLNCAALPESVAESELFTMKGAFTGAISNRSGLRWPITARCSSTKSANCRWRCRPSCCACCSMAIFSASAMTAACGSMCGCWRRPTAICARRWWKGAFAPICTIG